MKDINYALAPAGATHEYHGTWRMFDGEKWCFWQHAAWHPTEAVCVADYEPIPECEIAINRLADTLRDWPHDKMYCTTLNENNGMQITWVEWHKRCTERIEAGLIKENNDLADAALTNYGTEAHKADAALGKTLSVYSDVNDTDVVEIEDDLTWLAKNVDGWPTEIDSEGFTYYFGAYPAEWIDESWTIGGYTSEEWWCRRSELRLEAAPAAVVEIEEKGTNHYGQKLSNEFDHYMPDEFAKAIDCTAKTADESVLTEKEFAPEPSKEWINGLPSVGVECEWRDSFNGWVVVEITGIGRHGILFCEKGRLGENYVPKDPSRFRPIKTNEQIAAEKRDNEVDRMFKTLTIDNSSKAYKICQDLYDAGYRLTLEAPKGGDV